MPSKHSKANGHPGVFTYWERSQLKGTVVERLGKDSQLPFGYCSLSLTPIDGDAVISPSGRLYSKEAIYEYLLQKSRDLKALNVLYDEQEAKKRRMKEDEALEAQRVAALEFQKTQDGVQAIETGSGGIGAGAKRARDATTESEQLAARKRLIDDTSANERLNDLKRVSPWLVQFTPSANASELKAPPKRPLSPFSGEPLRAKDLLPITLSRDSSSSLDDASTGTVKFVCPVSLKPITSQPVVYLRGPGSHMLLSVLEQLTAGPSTATTTTTTTTTGGGTKPPKLTCPLTSLPFKAEDAVVLKRAVSGFAETGDVTASTFRHRKI